MDSFFRPKAKGRARRPAQWDDSLGRQAPARGRTAGRVQGAHEESSGGAGGRFENSLANLNIDKLSVPTRSGVAGRRGMVTAKLLGMLRARCVRACPIHLRYISAAFGGAAATRSFRQKRGSGNFHPLSPLQKGQSRVLICDGNLTTRRRQEKSRTSDVRLASRSPLVALRGHSQRRGEPEGPPASPRKSTSKDLEGKPQSPAGS